MRKMACFSVFVIAALLVSGALGQEKNKSNDSPKASTVTESKAETKAIVPIKVTVVFNEFDGEKKISSLPYTLFLKAVENRQVAVVRMGVKVPIAIGSNQIQYQDIGTNVDCFAQPAEDGKYILELTVDRSSLYQNVAGGKDDHTLEQSIDRQPVVRSFRANLALMLRDGQTTQSTVATDPLNGHTVRVDVTLNVVK